MWTHAGRAEEGIVDGQCGIERSCEVPTGRGQEAIKFMWLLRHFYGGQMTFQVYTSRVIQTMKYKHSTNAPLDNLVLSCISQYWQEAIDQTENDDGC